jgi:hypothetical protein
MNQLKVTPLRRDAESTNQLINLETTHACVITDPVTGFETTECTPADKHHKTLAATPSISYHDEAFALARRGRHFQTKTDANGKALQDTCSRAVNRIHCQIDGAFDLETTHFSRQKTDASGKASQDTRSRFIASDAKSTQHSHSQRKRLRDNRKYASRQASQDTRSRAIDQLPRRSIRTRSQREALPDKDRCQRKSIARHSQPGRQSNPLPNRRSFRTRRGSRDSCSRSVIGHPN